MDHKRWRFGGTLQAAFRGGSGRPEYWPSGFPRRSAPGFAESMWSTFFIRTLRLSRSELFHLPRFSFSVPLRRERVCAGSRDYQVSAQTVHRLQLVGSFPRYGNQGKGSTKLIWGGMI